MISFEQAWQLVSQQVQGIDETESVPIASALNRVLADDVKASINVPAYRNSAMDGYAFRHADLIGSESSMLLLIGTSMAGKPFTGTVANGQCVRIMTGAALPADCDTVVIQENVYKQADGIEIVTAPVKGQNIRHPGEDVAEGSIIFTAGKQLNAADIGVLASQGIQQINVVRKLKLIYFSSGDELRVPGETLNYGELYNSSCYSIGSLLQRPFIAAEYGGVLPDEPGAVSKLLTSASNKADVVVTMGGVSVGDADYIGDCVAQLGEVFFNKVAIKPGKPLTFGRIANSWLLGLPGNPVSALVTGYIMLLPLLRLLTGQQQAALRTISATLAETVYKSSGRLDFQRAIFSVDNQQQLIVNAHGPQQSHRLTSVSQANCLLMLPSDAKEVTAGSIVQIAPLALQ